METFTQGNAKCTDDAFRHTQQHVQDGTSVEHHPQRCSCIRDATARSNHAHSSMYAGSREKHSRVLRCSLSGIFTVAAAMRAYSRLLMMSSFVPIFVVKAAVSCARVSGAHIAAATHCLTFSILLVMLAVSFLFSLEAYDPTPLTASRGHVMKKGGKI